MRLRRATREPARKSVDLADRSERHVRSCDGVRKVELAWVDGNLDAAAIGVEAGVSGFGIVIACPSRSVTTK